MIDAVIAGSGPAGLSAALCLGRVARQVLVLDGGSWRSESSEVIHNFLSRDGATPAELKAAALAQLRRYPTIKVNPATAISAASEGGAVKVSLSDGRTVAAHRLVLATGLEDVPPDIGGLPERWGQSVVHCPYCHGFERAGLVLGVLAISEWSAHEALMVRRLSDDVTFYTNGEYTLTADQRDLLKARDVAICESQLARLEGPGATLERIVFTDGMTVPCEALFCLAPTRQRSDLAAQLGCKLLDDGAVEVNEFGQTSLPGVYAVGDMAHGASIVSAFQSVSRAAAEGFAAAAVIDQELLYST
jgi:thioredoxin reductase